MENTHGIYKGNTYPSQPLIYKIQLQNNNNRSNKDRNMPSHTRTHTGKGLHQGGVDALIHQDIAPYKHNKTYCPQDQDNSTPG